jgi:hypothetical protein
MKEIFISVISKGDYDLTALLKLIDKYHIEGKLTDAEREELYNDARNTVSAHYDFALEIEKLWAAIRELQSNGEVDTEVKEFVQPTGAHDAYQKGDRVRYNNHIYTCLLDNCVWSPDTLPSAWEIEGA